MWAYTDQEQDWLSGTEKPANATKKIEAKAKMSAGKLPPTFPIKPQADELRPFFERALWGKTEAMSGAADAEGGSGLAGGSDQRPEGWTHEDDDRVTKLTNAGSVSSLLPPPDPFQYWVRLGCVTAEADPAQTPPDSRQTNASCAISRP